MVRSLIFLLSCSLALIACHVSTHEYGGGSYHGRDHSYRGRDHSYRGRDYSDEHYGYGRNNHYDERYEKRGHYSKGYEGRGHGPNEERYEKRGHYKKGYEGRSHGHSEEYYGKRGHYGEGYGERGHGYGEEHYGKRGGHYGKEYGGKGRGHYDIRERGSSGMDHPHYLHPQYPYSNQRSHSERVDPLQPIPQFPVPLNNQIPGPELGGFPVNQLPVGKQIQDQIQILIGPEGIQGQEQLQEQIIVPQITPIIKCFTPFECHSGMFCSGGFCQCPPQKVFFGSRCEPVCERNKIRDQSGICQCRVNQIEHIGWCLDIIPPGGKCQVNEQCSSATQCINFTCQCSQGMVLVGGVCTFTSTSPTTPTTITSTSSPSTTNSGQSGDKFTSSTSSTTIISTSSTSQSGSSSSTPSSSTTTTAPNTNHDCSKQTPPANSASLVIQLNPSEQGVTTKIQNTTSCQCTRQSATQHFNRHFYQNSTAYAIDGSCASMCLKDINGNFVIRCTTSSTTPGRSFEVLINAVCPNPSSCLSGAASSVPLCTQANPNTHLHQAGLTFNIVAATCLGCQVLQTLTGCL